MSLTQINKAGLDEIALDHVFTIGATDSSAYRFQGEGLNGIVNNPTLYLTRGKTYRFENGSGAHPFRIQSTTGTSGTAYNTGVTNNNAVGTVIMEVQHDAPDVLYYQCTSHAAMNGILYIVGALADGGVTTAKLANGAVTNSKIDAGAVTTASLGTNAVTTAKILDSQVTAAKIADGAVTSAKIADGAIVNADINASAAIAGSKISPVFSNNVIINTVFPQVFLNDTDSNSDFKITNANGIFKIEDSTNTADRFTIASDGTSTFTGNLNANSGIDITGGATLNSAINTIKTNSDSAMVELCGGSTNNIGNGAKLTLHGDSHSSTGFVDLSSTSTGHLQFRTGTSKRLQIDSTGNSHFGSSATLSGTNTVSIIPADGRISFGMDGRSSFVTGENGAYIYSGSGSGGSMPAGDLIIQSRSNQNRTIRFVTGSTPTQRMSIDSAGLKFGTDTATANALDDYEEGTWTPDARDGSLSYERANYTKIGRMVYLSAYVYQFSDTSTNDSVTITGIPFTPSVISVAVGSVMYNNVSDTDNCTVYLASTGLIFYGGASSSYDQVRYNELNSGSSFYFQASYFAS